MNVVLVHGFMDTSRLFRTLERRLAGDGHVCHAPNLSPRDARTGIAALSQQVARMVEQRVGAEQPLAMVGFSMGAIVARHYLQLLGGHARTRIFFAISGPHAGTLTAYCYPGQGARDMRPGSPLLRELDAAAGCLAGMRLYSYWTPYDFMIVPPSSAQWPGARAMRVSWPWHAHMVRHRRIVEDISQRLKALADAPEDSLG